MEVDNAVAVRIRQAVPADAERLSAFAAEVFRDTYRATARPEDLESYIAAHFRADIQAVEIADPDERALVAALRHDLVGYAQLRLGIGPPCLQDASDVSAGALEIRRFYVAPRWRGQGIAQRLMAACLDGRLSTLPVWLGVFQHNARAIAFYTKCGFRVAGETVFYMGPTPEKDYVMVMDAGR